MKDIREFCPLWGEWEVVEKLGEGSFGAVWKMKRSDITGKVYYSAVKHISIPKDIGEVNRLLAEGIVSDEYSSMQYFEHMLLSISDEIDAIHTLQGYTNIVAYEDHKIIPKKDGIGYDLFLRMELLMPLTERIRKGMSVRDVVSLGTDIATAIDVLDSHQMIHRDIKPQNIFVNDKNIYKLGNYDITKSLGSDAAAMSRQGAHFYKAPEFYHNQKTDIQSDIYSLGLILYRLLNGNRLPFLPLNGNITAEQGDQAILRRISGEKIPAPAYADEELSRIVLKACAFNPKDRYLCPGEMVRDLERYHKNHIEPIKEDSNEKTIDPFDISQCFTRQERQPIPRELKELTHYQGIIWETGQLQGCVLLFPKNGRKQGITIGTEIIDSPDLLICRDYYVYYLVGSGDDGNPHEYNIIRNFDGTIEPAHSGDVFQFGKDKFRLI